MAKKEINAELSAEFKATLEKTKLINVEVNNEVKKSFIAYAMAVNVSRAIPDVRDGMKPVHRRILYAMHDMGLTSDKGFKKCVRTCFHKSSLKYTQIHNVIKYICILIIPIIISKVKLISSHSVRFVRTLQIG